MGRTFEVGDELRAVKRIAFKSGKVVEVGDVGLVTKVPGTVDGSPAQVRANGSVFSCAEGDFELHGAAHGAPTPERASQHDNAGAAAGPDGVVAVPSVAASDPDAFPDTGDEPCRTVPVRLTQYIDYVGHWGDTMQKQKVDRLQKQLESAAGRLSTEAAAKFEEVAWLQSELEKWHQEAMAQSRRADNLQQQLHAKDGEIARLEKGIEDRDADIAWLKAELQKKVEELNNALAEVARVEGQLRSVMDELKRLERVAQQRTSDEADRRRDLEKRYEEMRNAKKALEDKLYLKLEELARAEQAIRQLEQALRDGNAAFERAKIDWAQQMAAQQKMIDALRAQLAELRQMGDKGCRDAATQVTTAEASTVRDSTNQTFDEMKQMLYAREHQIQQLEDRLGETENYRRGLLDDLKAQLAQRDAHIKELEASTSREWRDAQKDEELLQRVADLESKLKRERMTNEDLQAKLDGVAAGYERRLREMGRRLKEAERQYAELQHMNGLLEAKNANAHEIIAQQQQEIARLKEEVGMLNESLMSHKARVDHLEGVVAQLQEILPKLHEGSVMRLLSPLKDALTLFPDRNPCRSPARVRSPSIPYASRPGIASPPISSPVVRSPILPAAAPQSPITSPPR